MSVSLRLLASSFVLLGMLILSQLFQGFNLAPIFLLVLYPSVTFLLLLALALSPDSKRVLMLFAVIFFHLIILSRLLPTFGIMIDERTAAMAKLVQTGHWDTDWRLLNPYYNPFPMDLGLFSMVSNMTSIGWMDRLNVWFVDIFFTLAYDLMIYSLIRRLGGNWRIGVIGILLIAFTPPLIVNATAQGLASFFLLMLMILLFPMHFVPTASNIVLVNLSYVAAIFTHGTSAISILLLSSMLAVSYLMYKIGKTKGRSLHKDTILRMTFVTIVVITMLRWIHVSGINIILDPIKSVIVDLLGYSSSEWIGRQYVPLYDQYVSPINAFAWSMPISMALTYTLYHLTRRQYLTRKKVLLTLSMCVGGGGALVAGFIGGVSSSYAGLQRYMGYSSLLLFIPAAAIVGMKALNSSGKKITLLFITLMILFSGIGISDPSLSPQLYKEMKTVSRGGIEDYLEVSQLYDTISSDMKVVGTYEVMASLDYFSATREKIIHPYVGSMKGIRLLIDKVIEEREVVADVVYIWSYDIETNITNMPVNIVYSSGRHLAFACSNAEGN
ncbi:MAG TPA: hypothetical protein VJ249_11295 [Candidatus Bathyarchaeia archaeon]|nr:hypothetical protein [Candidatus Bathyarchaeia archaeon]